jgi:hypothetical protein
VAKNINPENLRNPCPKNTIHAQIQDMHVLHERPGVREFEDLRWKFSTTKLFKTRVLPKAFTEKGLYMLATILKSPQAVKTTIERVSQILKKL